MSQAELVDCSMGILSVAETCRLLGVARSSYYACQNKRPSRRVLYDAVLAAEIRAIHLRSRCRYGNHRVFRALKKRGVRIARKRVARIMREEQLVARPKRRFRVTTNSDHSHAIAPNLLERTDVAHPNPIRRACAEVLLEQVGRNRAIAPCTETRSNTVEMAELAVMRIDDGIGSRGLGCGHVGWVLALRCGDGRRLPEPRTERRH